MAWNAVTRYAFLEYYFFYAYNDFERYQTAIFDNEHEGDDEGCCLVFDRNVLNLAATSGDPDDLLKAVPHCIIASVHEEYQDADLLKFVAPPIVAPGDPAPPARDVVDFTVYVAGGSHATYFTPGDHDLVDFQDTWGYVDENASWLYIIAPVVLAISIILAIIEHFVDTEDFTSDEGVHSGPDEVVGNHPAKVASHVLALPMSSGKPHLPASARGPAGAARLCRQVGRPGRHRRQEPAVRAEDRTLLPQAARQVLSRVPTLPAARVPNMVHALCMHCACIRA